MSERTSVHKRPKIIESTIKYEELQLTTLQQAQLQSDTLRQRLAEERRLAARAEQLTVPIIPEFAKHTWLNLDSFFAIVVFYYSRDCHECALSRQRSQASWEPDGYLNPLRHYCPHLVCDEWRLVTNMARVSRAFFRAFITSSVGKRIVLCHRSHVDRYEAGKRHGQAKPCIYTPRCSCRGVSHEKLCKLWVALGVDPTGRVAWK
jgi:hypothetical protein